MSELAELVDELRKIVIVPPAYRWVDISGICEMFGCSQSTAREKIVSHPKFPKPLKVGGMHSKWNMAEVNDWATEYR